MQAFQLNVLHAHRACSDHLFFSIFGVTLRRIIFKYKFHYPGKGTGGGGIRKKAASLWLLYLFSQGDNVFDILIQQQVNVHHMLYGSFFGQFQFFYFL